MNNSFLYLVTLTLWVAIAGFAPYGRNQTGPMTNKLRALDKRNKLLEAQIRSLNDSPEEEEQHHHHRVEVVSSDGSDRTATVRYTLPAYQHTPVNTIVSPNIESLYGSWPTLISPYFQALGREWVFHTRFYNTDKNYAEVNLFFVKHPGDDPLPGIAASLRTQGSGVVTGEFPDAVGLVGMPVYTAFFGYDGGFGFGNDGFVLEDDGSLELRADLRVLNDGASDRPNEIARACATPEPPRGAPAGAQSRSTATLRLAIPKFLRFQSENGVYNATVRALGYEWVFRSRYINDCDWLDLKLYIKNDDRPPKIGAWIKAFGEVDRMYSSNRGSSFSKSYGLGQPENLRDWSGPAPPDPRRYLQNDGSLVLEVDLRILDEE